MQFSKFAKFLQKLDATRSRNSMTEILADLFKKLAPPESECAAHLLLGELAAPYKKIDFKIGDKLLLKTIAFSFKTDLNQVKNMYKKLGDIGTLAENLSKDKSINVPISIENVYKELKNIALEEGSGSIEKKILLFSKLLDKLDSLSIKYVTRIPLGKLRLGFSAMTILDSLSYMETSDKSLRKDIEKGYNLLADIGLICKTFKTKGIKGMQSIKIMPGVPIRMAGAERLESPEKIFEKLKSCAIEPKYDGFRIQAHKYGDAISLFSRNLDNTSSMFPDIVKTIKDLSFKNIVFEGEAIAYNPQNNRFLPFQETIQRKRKYDIEKLIKSVPLKVFVYDILYFENEEVWNKPYKERRLILEKAFKNIKSKNIELTPQNIAKNSQDIANDFHKYILQGLEGIIAKKIDAPYQAGKRSFNWVKFKKTMEKKIADTFDCLIMGYYYGKGKRSKFGIGAFLVGVYEPKDAKFYTVTKIGTGVTDKEWLTLKKDLEKIKTKFQPKNYEITKNLIPDIYVEPQLIVEIGADEITKSPTHKAGLALRFPRLLKTRYDKSPDQATTIKELEKMYKMQRSNL